MVLKVVALMAELWLEVDTYPAARVLFAKFLFSLVDIVVFLISRGCRSYLALFL
jgi:hypothetical protein